MPAVQPYYTFLRNNAELNREQFLAKHSKPFLYFQNLPDLELTDLFTTMRILPGVTPADLGLQGILPLTKEANSNAFNMMITMGRAKNNDLIIPDKRVSKFHAYFRQVGSDWLITDANSTNGTEVNGLPVAPETSQRLLSGHTIKLSGAISVVFLAPDELWTQVQDARSWVT